jgi:hypothetical protein
MPCTGIVLLVVLPLLLVGQGRTLFKLDQMRTTRSGLAPLPVVGKETEIGRGLVGRRPGEVDVNVVPTPVLRVEGEFRHGSLDLSGTEGATLRVHNVDRVLSLDARKRVAIGAVVHAEVESVEVEFAARHDGDGPPGAHELEPRSWVQGGDFPIPTVPRRHVRDRPVHVRGRDGRHVPGDGADGVDAIVVLRNHRVSEIDPNVPAGVGALLLDQNVVVLPDKGGKGDGSGDRPPLIVALAPLQKWTFEIGEGVAGDASKTAAGPGEDADLRLDVGVLMARRGPNDLSGSIDPIVRFGEAGQRNEVSYCPRTPLRFQRHTQKIQATRFSTGNVIHYTTYHHQMPGVFISTPQNPPFTSSTVAKLVRPGENTSLMGRGPAAPVQLSMTSRSSSTPVPTSTATGASVGAVSPT